MKRCPTCNKTFTEANLSFCIDDGTPLVPVVSNDDATVAPPRFSEDRNTNDRAGGWNASGYQPPSYVQPPGTRERKVWPWVLGIVGVLVLGLVGLSIAIAVILPRMIRNAQSSRDPGPVVSGSDNANSNTNSNTNSNSSSNSNSIVSNENKSENFNASAPTDSDMVLGQLTNLEHEWTVANINADKKALGKILADDYAGPSENGQIQGKADYLKNISRDTSIQKWEFKNLKVTLHGDRATLMGTLILRRQNQDAAYSFVDKFVWRGGRWQATGSVVTPVQQSL